jgi:hypothetical protein
VESILAENQKILDENRKIKDQLRELISQRSEPDNTVDTPSDIGVTSNAPTTDSVDIAGSSSLAPSSSSTRQIIRSALPSGSSTERSVTPTSTSTKGKTTVDNYESNVARPIPAIISRLASAPDTLVAPEQGIIAGTRPNTTPSFEPTVNALTSAADLVPTSAPTTPAQPSRRALPGTQTNTAPGLEPNVSVLGSADIGPTSRSALPGTPIATNTTPRLASEDGAAFNCKISELEHEGRSELSDDDSSVASSSSSRASTYASSLTSYSTLGDAVELIAEELSESDVLRESFQDAFKGHDKEKVCKRFRRLLQLFGDELLENAKGPFQRKACKLFTSKTQAKRIFNGLTWRFIPDSDVNPLSGTDLSQIKDDVSRLVRAQYDVDSESEGSATDSSAHSSEPESEDRPFETVKRFLFDGSSYQHLLELIIFLPVPDRQWKSKVTGEIGSALGTIS